MKRVRPLLFAVIALAFVSQIGCKSNREDATPPPGSGIIYVDSAANTGQLTVHLRRWVGSPGANIGNGFVALYVTYEDYVNDIPLTDGRTNAEGRVDFGFLNIGNYYIYSEVETSPGNFNQRVDVVQIQARTGIVREIFHAF